MTKTGAGKHHGFGEELLSDWKCLGGTACSGVCFPRLPAQKKMGIFSRRSCAELKALDNKSG